MSSDAAHLAALEARLEVLEAKTRPRILCYGLPWDGLVSFLTKMLRMFAFGAIAPVLFLYMIEVGFTPFETGVLLTAILLGDLVITLFMSTRADTFGRRATLIIGCFLKGLAGIAFASTSSFPLLVVAGIVGVISSSGGEIGPFVAVEQACLTESVLDARGGGGSGEVAVLFGYYTAFGYLAQAGGALSSGLAVHLLTTSLGWSRLDAYRSVFFGYGVVGGLMALCYMSMSSAVEAKPKPSKPRPVDEPKPCCPPALAPYAPAINLGLRRAASRHIVARLSLMFAMDAFAGAFVMQTWIAFWFASRWGFSNDYIGYLLMGANIVAGVSGVAAAYFVKKYGAMLTMIASHLPSNILLLAVPLMPTGATAAAMLVARFSISQMDVPARQAYVVMVVASDERSAAGGITNIVRSLGASLSPLLLGYLSSAPVDSWVFSSPWVIAGFTKIAYDIILYSLYLCDNTMTQGEANATAADARERKEGSVSAQEAGTAPLLGDAGREEEEDEAVVGAAK